MKYMIIGFLLFAFRGLSISKNELWTILKNGDGDERVEAAIELQAIYDSDDLDSMRIVANMIFQYGFRQEYYPALEIGKIFLAECMIIDAEFASAISLLKETLPKARLREDYGRMSLISRNLCEIYQKIGNGELALYWAKQGRKFANISVNLKEKRSGFISLAQAYRLLNDKENAEKYFNLQIELARKNNDNRRLSSACALFGDYYRNSGNLKLAKKYFQFSLDAALKTNLRAPVGHAINNMAIIAYEEGKSKEALKGFLTGLNTRLKNKDTRGVVESLYNLGDFYFYENEIDKAISYYKESYKIATDKKYYFLQKDALNALVILSKSTEDYKGATMYYDQMGLLDTQMKKDEQVSDMEWADVQRDIIRAEFDVPNKVVKPTGFLGYFKIEWLVIIILLVTLYWQIYKRKK